MEIRRAARADHPRLWALNALPFKGHTADPRLPLDLPSPAAPPPNFPDLADVEQSFILAGGDFLLAELHGHVVGMGGFVPREDRAEVLRVRVHPATRRRGVGRALMAALEARAAAAGYESACLDTTTEQPEAIAFYESLGYGETGRRAEPGWTLVFFEKALRARSA